MRKRRSMRGVIYQSVLTAGRLRSGGAYRRLRAGFLPLSLLSQQRKPGLVRRRILGVLLATGTAAFQAQSAPANDELANAAFLEGTAVIAQGSNVDATHETDEPRSSVNPGGKSVWWQWTAPATGGVEVDTLGSDFDTLLAVFAPNETAGYQRVGEDDDSGGGYASRMAFSADSGTTYFIKVDGYNPWVSPLQGNYGAPKDPLNAQSGSIRLTLRQGEFPPWIRTQPKDESPLMGGVLRLTVSVTGVPPVILQWWKDHAPIPDGTNAALMIDPVSVADSGFYFVTASNSVGAVTSSVAKVFVAPTRVMTQPQSLTVGTGYDAVFSIRLSSAGSAFTQWHKDGLAIEGATNSILSVTNVTAGDAGVYAVQLSNSLGMGFSDPATLAVVTPYTLMTLAGQAGQPGHADGAGSVARFTFPVGITADQDGTLYVTEAWPNLTVRRITGDGVVTTLAGQPGVMGTNDGVGSAALFSFPEDIVVDDQKNLYVADNFGHTIRKLTLSADGEEYVVSTLAGTPLVRGWQDGPSDQSLFYAPSALALDSTGNLYIAEWGNSAVRRLTPDGMVTTLAGSKKAGIARPTGIAVDAHRNLHVVCVEVPAVIKVTPGGRPSRHGTLPRDTYGGSLDVAGNVWVAGSVDQDGRLRAVPREGETMIVAGARTPGFADGCGSAARLSGHRSRVFTDRHGNVYLSDNDNHVIRKAVPFAVMSPANAYAVPAGTPVDLRVDVQGAEDPVVQWARGGQVLPQETNQVLSLGPVDRTNSDTYSVLVRHGDHQWVLVSSAVNGYHPHRIVSVEVLPDGGRRLLSQDDDGALPVAPERLKLQWASVLTSGGQANWQNVAATASVTNGWLRFDDPGSAAGSTRFYRIEQP